MTTKPSGMRKPCDPTRAWCAFLGTWHVCGNTACVRARACRGNFGDCAPKNFRRLPQLVQDWFLLLLVAKEDGLTWDETMERLNKTPLNQATDEWLRSLHGAEAERVAAR